MHWNSFKIYLNRYSTLLVNLDTSLDPTQLLNGLNPAQRKAAEHITGPLLIVAGAGAGKTRTLTHRIAHLIANNVPAHSILAITFTNKAAQELKERLNHLLPPGAGQPTTATFHSLGVQILRQHGKHIGIKSSFSIIDRGDQEKMIKEILKDLGYDGEQWTPRKVLGYISNRRSGRAGKLDQLESVNNRYHVLKAERSTLDFDDLIYRTVELIRDINDVRTTLQNRWSHLHVDEYQDTNTSQYELVQLLAGDQKNVCVVGDTDQTIYTWRGAEIKNLMRFETDFPGTTTVMLEENYRSSKTIIAVANDCIRKNKTRIEKTLFTNNDDGEKIQIMLGTNENDEARQIATEISRLISNGINSNEIAILYRANFQSQALEKALIQQNISYDLLGTKFYQRIEIKDMLAYLRYALNPDNPLDLDRIAGVPKRGIGPKTVQAIINNDINNLGAGAQKKAREFMLFIDKIKGKVNSQPVSQVMEFILDESGWRASLDDDKLSKSDQESNQDRLENLSELISVASEYDQYNAPLGVQKILEESALMSEQDTYNDQSQVRLMTIHASKGLEFDNVFITGLEQGLFPSDRSDSARDQEEERRLFYVALTRARKKAYLSYATMRHRFGSMTFNTPSEFITEIDPQYLDEPESTSSFGRSSSGFGRPSGKMGLLDDIEF